jgi:hypothetical protein
VFGGERTADLPKRSGPYRITLQCFFDSQTKDYIGVSFIFNAVLKDYLTTDKINKVELLLLQAKINAGLQSC